MNYEIATLASLLFVSLSANAYLLRRKPKKLKQSPDITAADLLHDLTKRGQALIKIEVIDAANLLLRSPRQ